MSRWRWSNTWPRRIAPAHWPAAVALPQRSARDDVLREAAALGVDLLSGEEAHA